MSMILYRPQYPPQHRHPRRDFNPHKTARFGRPTFMPDRLVKYSPKWQYSRIFNFPYRGSCWRPRMHTIVIAVDGASKGNHLAGEKTHGAWGVFFGPKCARNESDRLTGPFQTNSRAELEAVRQALISVRDMYTNQELDSFRYNEIIIKTDSTYVHDTFNKYIWRYEVNGYIKFNGQPAAHAGLIEEIHDRICELEAWNRAIRFWRVDRKWNSDADSLANEALAD